MTGLLDDESGCTCARIVLNAGREVVGRDWRADCPEHGEASEWYARGGQRYFAAYRDYTVLMQRLAREARATGQSQSHRIPPPPRLEDFRQ